MNKHLYLVDEKDEAALSAVKKLINRPVGTALIILSREEYIAYTSGRVIILPRDEHETRHIGEE